MSFNYAIVAVGAVIIYSVGFWVLSARKWFTGPVKQIEGESLHRSIFLHQPNVLMPYIFQAEEMGIDVTDPAEAEKFEAAIAQKA